MTTKTIEVMGLVWQADDEHEDGGYPVAAKVLVRWSDETELVLDVSRFDGGTGETFYMSPDEAKNLMVAIGGALVDA